jgi:hypothetical protein
MMKGTPNNVIASVTPVKERAMEDAFDLQLRTVPAPAAGDATMADTVHLTLCLADGGAGCQQTVWRTCFDTCCYQGSAVC